MSLSSLNLTGLSVFELESGQPDKKRTKLHQFQKEPNYDGASISLSSFNSIGQSDFELESGNGNFDGTNRQKADK